MQVSALLSEGDEHDIVKISACTLEEEPYSLENVEFEFAKAILTPSLKILDLCSPP
jgi:hypothetical protein